jgi:hypothetical protein
MKYFFNLRNKLYLVIIAPVKPLTIIFPGFPPDRHPGRLAGSMIMNKKTKNHPLMVKFAP